MRPDPVQGSAASRRRWLLTSLSLRHRFTVTVPMNAIAVVENLIGLLTLGYIQPGWSMSFAVRQSMLNARRYRAQQEAING